MREAIDKAAALVEAHEYIRQFRGRTIVVKIGGSIMDQPDALKSLLGDICFMDTVGMKPVLVHGGGKAITQAMERAGLEAHFVQGRRYTDERTLLIAEHVLVNEINGMITQQISDAGHKAMGLHSLASCVVFAKKLFLDVDDDSGAKRKVDLGLVGQVESINTALLKAMLEGDYIPIIAPIARDEAGGKLNVNADSVAGHVAAALEAEKLVLVSDTDGIITSKDSKEPASHLTRHQIEQLIDEGIIDAGMLPKVEASFTALEGGVAKAHIVDGRVSHSLMLEVYTDKGVGTEIVL